MLYLNNTCGFNLACTLLHTRKLWTSYTWRFFSSQDHSHANSDTPVLFSLVRTLRIVGDKIYKNCVLSNLQCFAFFCFEPETLHFFIATSSLSTISDSVEESSGPGVFHLIKKATAHCPLPPRPGQGEVMLLQKPGMSQQPAFPDFNVVTTWPSC